jgi:hypothetical protein
MEGAGAHIHELFGTAQVEVSPVAAHTGASNMLTFSLCLKWLAVCVSCALVDQAKFLFMLWSKSFALSGSVELPQFSAEITKITEIRPELTLLRS